ncbi:glycerophosphodiester phosphodiesterase family protein [Proteiniclasticum sp. C24MP]|uniref:glycerophosphodiester phosphodiesterase family protein n=1 Tax=Proteiniclasticum sp. C24MP TaxID=3374101 RepID=UPI003754C778
MYRDLMDSIKDMRKHYRLYVNFGLLYLILFGIIFVPLLSYVINRIFLSVEGGVLLNLDVFKILLRPSGLISVLGLLLLSTLFLFVLFGTYLILSQKKIFQKEILVSEAALTAVRAIPRLFRFELFYLVLLLFLLIPLVEFPTNPVLRRFIDVPPTLVKNIDSIRFGTALYIGALLLMVYFLIRWMFAFHEVFFERKSIRASLKSSARLTRGIRGRLLLRLLLVNVVLLGMFILFFYLVAQIPAQLNLPVNYIVRDYFITFTGLSLFIYLMMLLPVNLLYLTRVYYREREKLGLDVEDKIRTVKWNWIMKREEELRNNLRNKRIAFIFLFMLSLLISFTVSYRVNDGFLYTGRKILVAAHRADAMNAPENSLSAIESALSLGAGVIEMDVQMTEDGVLVLHHDTSLLRMVGVPESVADFTYEELMELEIGSRFDDAFTGERIPTLTEALQVVKDRGEVLLDVKVNDKRSEVAVKILQELEESGMKEFSYIQSFDYGFLREIRALDKEIRLGQILYAAFGRLDQLDVDFYTVQLNMLSQNLVKRAHDAERGIFVWVVKTEEELKNALQYDIDGIITGDVSLVSDMLGTTPLEEELTEEETP